MSRVAAEAGDDREQDGQDEVGGVGLARGRRGELAREHGDGQGDEGQLRDDRPAARRHRTAYAGELGRQRLAHHQADRDARHGEGREQHQRGGGPARPTAAGAGGRAPASCAPGRTRGRARSRSRAGSRAAAASPAPRGRGPTADATVTPRREARASSGTRSSLAALSSRMSSASATRTSDSTAGAIELRAVDCWKRDLVDDGREVVGVVGDEGAAVDLDGGVRGHRRADAAATSSCCGRQVGRHVEVGVDPDRPVPEPRRRSRRW